MYTINSMALTKDDRQYIQDTIITALEQVVLPRFDEHDKRFDAIEVRLDRIENDIRVLKEDVRILQEDVRVLKDDMREVKSSLSMLNGRVEALENDVKELYKLQNGHDNLTLVDKKFAKLPIEEKILVFNAELLKMAKQAGITLPR